MSSTLESGSPAIAWGGVLLGTLLLAGSAIGAVLLIRQATRPAPAAGPPDAEATSTAANPNGPSKAAAANGKTATRWAHLSRRRMLVAGSVAALLLLVAVPVLASRTDNTPTGLPPPWGGAKPPSTSNRPDASPPTNSEAPPSGEPTLSAGAPPQPNRPASTPAAATAAVPPASPAQNLILDPGFEAASPSWTTFGPNTVLTPVTTAHGGSRSLQVTTKASGTVSTGTTTQPVRAITAAGKSYTATCWVRSATSIGAYVQLQEYTQAWQRVGDPVSSPKTTLDDPNRWVPVSINYTAVGSGNLLPLTVFSNSLRNNSGALLVDDCSLTST
jgi:hypothetical protein